MSKLRRLIAIAVGAFAAVLLPVVASAQPYPAKPIRMIIPFPAGGSLDIIGRYIAPQLTALLGQTVIIDNRGGAGGIVGTAVAAKAPADGYTIVLNSAGPMAAGIKLYDSMGYDPLVDLAAIGMVAHVDMVMVVTPKFLASDIAALIKYGRSEPGKLRVAINSPGSTHHLLTEHFLTLTGIDAIKVPYKGSGPAVLDLTAGTTDLLLDSLPVVSEQLRGNRLRAIATASSQRIPAMPDVPTLAEVGYKDLVANPWYVLAAPAGTPAEIITKLNVALNGILKEPATKAFLAGLGAQAVITSPSEAQQFIKVEAERWGKIVTDNKIRLE